MNHFHYYKLTIGLGILFTLANACTKQEPEKEPVTDSIYGTYIKSSPTIDQWTDSFNGTIIKVKPHNSKYLTIKVTEVSLLVAIETIFDSVQIASDRTFTVNTVSPDAYGNSSPPFYPRKTGSGSFGNKTISMDFKRIVQENPLLFEPYVYHNVEKTSDQYP